MGRMGRGPCAKPTTPPRVDLAELDASGWPAALLTEAAATLELRTTAMERMEHAQAAEKGPKDGAGYAATRTPPSARGTPPSAAPWTRMEPLGKLEVSSSEGGYAGSSRRETWTDKQAPTPSPLSPAAPTGIVVCVRNTSKIRCRKNVAGRAVAHHDLLL